MTENERIQKIVELEQISSQQFAEEIGIQPSTLSNIIRGRNKPSLDVMQKVLSRYKTISPEWLILGYGPVYRQKFDSQQPTLFDIPPQEPTESSSYAQPVEEKKVQEIAPKLNNESSNVPKHVHSLSEQAKSLEPTKKIVNILVFYDDNTFEEVTNR